MIYLLLKRYSPNGNGGSTAQKPYGTDELDDEYLPTCCRNGGEHSHPV